MADYKYTSEANTGVLRYSDNASIPADIDNADYRQYLQYVDEGGVTDPWKTTEELQLMNASIAQSLQTTAARQLEADNLAISSGLPPRLTENARVDLENYVQLLQGDIDHPAVEYVPPEKPDIIAPEYENLTCTVTRIPGWNDVLGYRFVIDAIADDFEPGVLSMAVYTNPNCDSYLYTTGAFVWDDVNNEWYATCPAGHEPGNEDIHFGVLRASEAVSCFTLLKDIDKKVFNIVMF